MANHVKDLEICLYGEKNGINFLRSEYVEIKSLRIKLLHLGSAYPFIALVLAQCEAAGTYVLANKEE